MKMPAFRFLAVFALLALLLACKPEVTSIHPMSVPAGSADFVLTLEGKNFAPDAVVIWRSADGEERLVPSSVTPERIEVTIPARLVAEPNTDDGQVNLAKAMAPRRTTIMQVMPVGKTMIHMPVTVFHRGQISVSRPD